ncbi:hypothetical protein BASA61_010230 [Batrachochytrium salamandrivorans]|nr:hypothetical protein BASA61_010230 [Batrachochytrium salamandrivorans]
MNLGDRSSDTHMASSFSLPPPAPERASSGSISNSLHYPTGSAIHAGVSSTPPRFQKVSRGVPKSKEVASPTINTKAAMADIFEMFTVPLAAEDPEACAAVWECS